MSNENTEMMDTTEECKPNSIPACLSDVVLDPNALPSTMVKFGLLVRLAIIAKLDNNSIPGINYDKVMPVLHESKPHVILVRFDKDYASSEIGLKKAQYGVGEVVKIVVAEALNKRAKFPNCQCISLSNYNFGFDIDPSNPNMYRAVVQYHISVVP